MRLVAVASFGNGIYFAGEPQNIWAKVNTAAAGELCLHHRAFTGTSGRVPPSLRTGSKHLAEWTSDGSHST